MVRVNKQNKFTSLNNSVSKAEFNFNVYFFLFAKSGKRVRNLFAQSQILLAPIQIVLSAFIKD